MRRTRATREEPKPTVTLTGGVLRCALGDAEAWRLGIDDLRLVGEHTTDHGPWADDWFVVFCAGHPAVWYEVPMTAAARALADLGDALAVPIVAGLAGSTDFASRVLWPAPLAGAALFDYAPLPRGRGMWRQLQDWFLPRIGRELTAEVRGFLDERAR